MLGVWGDTGRGLVMEGPGPSHPKGKRACSGGWGSTELPLGLEGKKVKRKERDFQANGPITQSPISLTQSSKQRDEDQRGPRSEGQEAVGRTLERSLSTSHPRM